MVGWVFFRAGSLTFALDYIKSMFDINTFTFSYEQFYNLISPEMIVIIMIAIIGSMPVYKIILKIKHRAKKIYVDLINIIEYVYIYIVLFISLAALASSTYNPFIYFRF